MDFDFAVQRLAKDHKKIKTRKPVVVSEKAKRVAELQRRQQAELQARRQRERREAEFQRHYWTRCNRSLGVKSISGRHDANDDGVDDKGSSTPSLQLKATSIHGEGDKISFAPSVLETLMAKMPNDKIGTPWSFRIGILNPSYTFPASPLLQMLKPPASEDDDDDDDHAMDVDDADDDYAAAYLDELNYKYIAYRHCSVIEFTQDEGHVGIPRPIASALLDPENRPLHFANFPIPTTRTLDPSRNSEEMTEPEESEEMATPGHVAYNAFDVPDLSLEVSLVKLPKGTGCTLVPTQHAIQSGFYGLKDVKLVLEQSIVRTRLTLSMGDIVSTWHRGVKFDLKVTTVLPSRFQAISCFNTDIVVDIGEATSSETEPERNAHTGASFSSGTKDKQEIGQGHVLGSSSSASTIEKVQKPTIPEALSSTPPLEHPIPSSVSLRPEPPEEQTENVVLVQIRHSSGSDKRRLDVSVATVQDLLDFATSLIGKRPSQFRLVTRFPRRVFTDSMGFETLSAVGISPGQEMFMVEQQD